MRNSRVIVALLACAAGCGDNSKACGPGTIDDHGTCVPSGTCGFGTKPDEETGQCVPDPSACAGGTIYDPLTGTCKIDPASCQNGTVLINNECVDPAAALVIDVQEGPEPNGMGIIEASGAQAGNITIKPVGMTYVVHGSLAPWRDGDGDSALDPDVDTYVVQATKPVLLEITADGLGGVLAGFVAVAAVPPTDPLADWQRYSVHVAGDTSRRQVLLPKAGTYRIAIADARTLAEYEATGTSTAASSGDYYVSINDVGLPVATPLTPVGGVASVTGAVAADTLAFYTVPMGSGFNAVSLAMPSQLATASAVVLDATTFRAFADETALPARVIVGDITNALVVVDHTSNVTAPVMDYTLAVTTTNATPLSATGGTVSTPSTGTSTSDLSQLAQFSFDVTVPNMPVAMQLGWSPAVIGQLYDGTGTVAATFTSPCCTTTWSSFRGIVRLAAPGRYYFAVRSASPNTVAVTSTLALAAPTPITLGTPLAATPNGIRVDAFEYTIGMEPWQQFDVTGTGTGGQAVAWLDPALAFGRLDTLATSAGTLTAEVAPLFTHNFPTGGGAIGRIVLDGPTSYFVKVTAQNPMMNPTLALDFRTRANAVDLGTITTSTSRTGDTIDSTTPARLYLFRAAASVNVTITVTPTSAVNTQFRRLRADETALGALINNPNGPDVETFVQTPGTWTAFVVSAAGGLSAPRTFDVNVVVQ